MQLPDDQTGPPMGKSLSELVLEQIMQDTIQGAMIPYDILEPAKPHKIESGWNGNVTEKHEAIQVKSIQKLWTDVEKNLEEKEKMKIKADPFQPKKQQPPQIFSQDEEILDEMDMWWHTKDGKKMKVSEMETRHMFFALRMHFNRHVPKVYQIELHDAQKFDPRPITSSDRQAFQIFFHQIQKRDNITEEQLSALSEMARVLRKKVV